jgi:hypothetical protein
VRGREGAREGLFAPHRVSLCSDLSMLLDGQESLGGTTTLHGRPVCRPSTADPYEVHLRRLGAGSLVTALLS